VTAPGAGVVATANDASSESAISRDLVRHAAMVLPLFVVFGALVGRVHGAVSAAVAVALVCANFLVSAALITVTARISLGLMMGAVLFGYLVRLALIGLAIVAVRDASWFHALAFGATLVVTHLGLLFWETRYVSASLAFPGLKPALPTSRTTL
jgi:hypothetical protein